MSSAGPSVPPPGNKGPVIGLLVLITGIVIAGGVTYQLTGDRRAGDAPTAPTAAATGSAGSTASPGRSTTSTAAAAPSAPVAVEQLGSSSGPSVTTTPLLITPPPGYEEALQPLGTPPANRRPTNAFAFQRVRQGGGGPVAFDPCRPLHVVIRPDGAPPGGEKLLLDAIRAASAATGLRIVYDGHTDEAPRLDRPSYDPSRYPERWAPVLVAWVPAAFSSHLAGDLAFSADLQSVLSTGRPEVFVSGTVLLDAPQLSRMMADRRQRDVVRHTMLSAAGMMVGLAATDAPGQVMTDASPIVRTAYQAGDLFGLAELGRGPCAPWL